MTKHNLLNRVCRKFKANKIKVLDKKYRDHITSAARHEYIVLLYTELLWKPKEIAKETGLVVGSIYQITIGLKQDTIKLTTVETISRFIVPRDNSLLLKLLYQEKENIEQQIESINVLIKLYKP